MQVVHFHFDQKDVRTQTECHNLVFHLAEKFQASFCRSLIDHFPILPDTGQTYTAVTVEAACIHQNPMEQ